MRRRLLLISTSRIHGQPYMAYCEDTVKAFWGKTREILFVPFAAQDQAAYSQKVRAHLEPMGFSVIGLDDCEDKAAAIANAGGIFVGGGNTFLLTKTMYQYDLMPLVRERVLAGKMLYMGSSAGSNLACPTMMTTNDMPIVQPPSFETLHLVPFQINAHYHDPDPNSTHMGETRADRLREYHQWNNRPVLGLREGAMVQVDGDRAELLGQFGARLFQANQEPQELEIGADLSFLLVE